MYRTQSKHFDRNSSLTNPAPDLPFLRGGGAALFPLLPPLPLLLCFLLASATSRQQAKAPSSSSSAMLRCFQETPAFIIVMDPDAEARPEAKAQKMESATENTLFLRRQLHAGRLLLTAAGEHLQFFLQPHHKQLAQYALVDACT